MRGPMSQSAKKPMYTMSSGLKPLLMMRKSKAMKSSTLGDSQHSDDCWTSTSSGSWLGSESLMAGSVSEYSQKNIWFEIAAKSSSMRPSPSLSRPSSQSSSVLPSRSSSALVAGL